jgi:phosphoribosylglycinamide formyltransferase 1
LRISVFVSGRGSNLEALLKSLDLRRKVDIVAVISDKSDCGAFKIAEREEIPTFVIGDGEEEISLTELKNFLLTLNLDLILLAGFLKMIPTDVVKVFNGKIINIHPALLPSFGGKGMYGMNVHKKVFQSGVKFSGVTVHFVNEEYDKGLIIAQTVVDISDVGSPEEIAERVLKEEHKLLPLVIEKFADGKVVVENDRVQVIN